MKQRYVIPTLVAFAFLLTLLPFQNCAQPTSTGPSTSASTTKFDGGNGYDGKRREYVLWDSSNNCADGIREKIEIDYSDSSNGVAFRTRRDCKDISPEPILSVASGLAPYNEFNLINGKRPFDLLEAGQESRTIESTKILCRGDIEKRDKNIRIQADVIVKMSTVQMIKGRVFLGVFDATTGDYLDRQEDDEVTLVRRTDDDGTEYFVDRIGGEKKWRLVVPASSGEPGALHITLANNERVTAKIPCYRP